MCKSGSHFGVLYFGLVLEARLAFWVSMGIPLCFLELLAFTRNRCSINMVSLFAFIVTLGLVVDDAIVVGEKYLRVPRHSWLDAAILGARQMSVPVTFAVLTTVTAFHLFCLSQGLWKVFQLIPVVVIAV